MRSPSTTPLRLLALLPLLLLLGADEGEWKLVWSDEFDAKSSPDGLPNPSKWGYETGFVRNREARARRAGPSTGPRT